MIITSLQLIARRSAAHWRLLTAVIVGVVLAVTIMASSVVYFDSLRDLGLTRDLSTQDPAKLDIVVQSTHSPVSPGQFDTHFSAVESRIDSRYGWFASATYFGLKSQTFYFAGSLIDGLNHPATVPPINTDLRRLFFASMRGVEDRSTLVAGAWPGPPASRIDPDAPVIDVVVTEDGAAVYGAAIGAILHGAAYWEDAHRTIDARVVGIIRPDPEYAEFWRVHDDGFGVANTSFRFAALLVPENTFLGPLGAYFPKMAADYTWVVDTDISAIHADDATRITADLARTDSELRASLQSYRQLTDLGSVLNQFGTRLFFNRLPMFVVLILVVLVVVYYVLTIGGLLVDAQRSEIALLRSRGATSRQIVTVYAVEAFALAGVSLVVGPLLALAGVSLMGAVPMFSGLNDGGLLPVRLTWSVYRMGAIGALLGLLALLVPSLRAARVGLLQYRQGSARPARLPLFQRYYLDLGVLGLVLFFFWQLSRQGSFVAVRLLGDVVVDQLVLAVPAMFLIAAGLVLIRVFPVMVDVLGRILSSRWLSGIASPALVLGLWQMARNPAHHARLSLLLILTAGLGVFAASFGATLQRSFTDRVNYDTGAQVRLEGFSPLRRGMSINPVGTLTSLDGVVAVSPVFRSNAAVLSQESVGSAQALGIDPSTFALVAWSRPDFVDGTLENTIAKIDSFDRSGIELPADAAYLSVLVHPSGRRGDAGLVARISDADGRFYTYSLGTLAPFTADQRAFPCDPGEPEGPIPWCRIGASLQRPSGVITLGAPAPPLRLEAIGVTPADPRQFRSIRGGSVEIDDISVTLSDGSVVVIDGFEDVSGWGVMASTEDAIGDSLEPAVNRDGIVEPGIAAFSWTSGFSGEVRGAVPGGAPKPMPALLSPSLMKAGDYSAGDTIDLSVGQDNFSVEVVGAVPYFPTLDPNTSPFLIFDGRSLDRATSIAKTVEGLAPNELWLSLAPGETVDAIRPTLDGLPLRVNRIVDRAAELQSVAVDPLVSAGWRALLAIAFFTVLLVSAIGFIVHAQVTFRTRRTELALLRATGLSMRQLLALVTLEQLLVIGAGFATGAFIGARLGATIMPYLGNSGEGLKVAPPMVLQIDWGSVAATFGVVAVVFVSVIGLVLFSVYRMSVHRVLRLGER